MDHLYAVLPILFVGRLLIFLCIDQDNEGEKPDCCASIMLDI